jgi:hypothetical protein
VHNIPPHSPSYTFSLYSLTSHWCQPQTEPVLPSHSLFLKKMRLCLYNTAIQAVSLWHFHLYMYWILNLFIPFSFLFSTLVPFYGDYNRFKNSVFVLV